MNQSLYPWFQSAWAEMNLAKMPHAILLHGQGGIGKLNFALHLAKALLCESTSATNKPCCSCEACHWFDTGNHPDFLGLVPESQAHLLPHEQMQGDLEDKPKRGKKKADDEGEEKADKKASVVIKVDQVREALDGIATSPHRGIQRVILINPIETLPTVSANTLLKNLEEPPESTLFILVSDRLDRILPTIRSRCRLIALPRPNIEEASQWLQAELQVAGRNASIDEIRQALNESGGAVLDAKQQLLGAADADESKAHMTEALLKGLGEGAQINWLAVAEAIHKSPMPDILLTLERWIADLLSQQQSGLIRYYPLRQKTLEQCSKNARTQKLSAYWKALLDARRHELHALANRVQVEALLIRYQEVFKD